MAAYTREWRKTHKQSEEARKKSNCRSYANAYKRMGKLKPQPCRMCGLLSEVQMHHPDYNFPLRVVWLCRGHHEAYHRWQDDEDTPQLPPAEPGKLTMADLAKKHASK